jgi:hypothetical protein
MCANLPIADGVGAIVKKRFLLFVTTAVGSLCLAAASALGQNWTLTSAPTNAWSAVACSADGMRIVAVVAGGGIYTSTSLGTNWNLTMAPSNEWSSVCCSTNGATIVAAVNGGGIWTSTDYGTNWNPSMALSNGWTGLACSADGTRDAAVSADGIWTSTNAGEFWSTNAAPMTSYISVACSADGNMIVADQNGLGMFWISDDAGSTWMGKGYADYRFVSCSGDATKIAVAATADGSFTLSTNSGIILTSEWECIGPIAFAADGETLIGVNCASSFCVSLDSGSTWSPLGGPIETWDDVSLAVAADGNKFVAVVNGGGIYTWQLLSPVVVGEPQSQTAIGGNGVALQANIVSTSPLTYQWQCNGTNLPGATNATFTLTNVNLANSGSYVLLVSNSFGSVSSSVAVLTVVPALLTTQSPDPALYDANLMASIATGSNSTALYFEWGVDTNYGHQTQPIILQDANASSITNLITGLTPYTTYHFQAVASNVFGTVLGGDVSFTTVPRFVQVGTNTDWSALVLSGDGRELAATLNGIVYVSTNLGVTFMPTTGTGSVFAVSSNGATILAASGTNIDVSLDRGETWVTNFAPAVFSIFAASSSAQYLAAMGGTLYTSTNFGATWIPRSIPYGYTVGLASSADGSILYGAGSAGYETIGIYASHDYGNDCFSLAVFGETLGPGGIACSGNGSVIAEASENYVMSTNGGASWSGYGQPTYGSVACSADGQTILLAAYGGAAVSPDTGGSWYYVNGPYSLSSGSVRSSADGKTLAELSFGSIYLSTPPPSQPSSLSETTSISNGWPVFQLTGQAGYTYDVQASTNLSNWTTIAVLVNTNGVVPFSDPAATNYNQRFYRAVAP